MGTYRYELMVPANTAKGDAVTQELKLHPGRLTRFILAFPKGCYKLVHARVAQPGGFSYPINPDGDFAADDYVFDLNDPVELTRGADKFIWSAWSTDDTYDHTLHLTLIVQEPERSPVAQILELLRNFIRRL